MLPRLDMEVALPSGVRTSFSSKVAFRHQRRKNGRAVGTLCAL
jgi:hypothetical protein